MKVCWTIFGNEIFTVKSQDSSRVILSKYVHGHMTHDTIRTIKEREIDRKKFKVYKLT